MQDLKYSFQLSIEQDRESILEITVGAADSAESVAKARATIQQMLNEFTPGFPEGEPQAPPKPAKIAEAEQVQAADSGIKGFVLIQCEKCGRVFRSFLRSPQKMLSCKCGHHIDLTAHLTGFEYTCESCGRKGWGSTNIEDTSMVRCLCGEQAELYWSSEEKAYRLKKKESGKAPEPQDSE